MATVLQGLHLVINALLVMYPPLPFAEGKLKVLYLIYAVLFTALAVAVRAWTLTHNKLNNISAVLRSVTFMNILIVIWANILITFQLIAHQGKVQALVQKIDFLKAKNRHCKDYSMLTKVFVAICCLSILFRLTIRYMMLFSDLNFLSSLMVLCIDTPVIRTDGILLMIFLVSLQLKKQLSFVNETLKCRNSFLALAFKQKLLQEALNCVDLLNGIFGNIIACGVVSYILVSLENVVRLMTFTDENDIKYTIGKVSSCLSGVHVLTLALIGEQLSTEARRTVDICYEMCQDTEEMFTIDPDRDVQRQYELMAEQTHQRNVKLSAAGFFPVDHSIIVFIFTTVCTYVIAICQLQSPHTSA